MTDAGHGRPRRAPAGARKYVFLPTFLLCFSGSPDPSVSCEFRLGSYALEVVRDGGGHEFAYRLKSDDAFLLSPFGWHGTALVECRACRKDAFVRGAIWLGTDPQAAAKPAIAPGTEISNSFKHWYESPYDLLRAFDYPAPISFGPLKGWSSTFAASFEGKVTHDVVEAEATDGCVSIRLRVEATHSTSRAPVALAFSLMRSIQVSITPIENDRTVNGVLNSPQASSRPNKLTFDQFRKAIGR